MHICIIFNISYLVDVHGDMPKHEERSSEFQTKTPTPKNGDTSKVADKNRDSNLLNRVQESHRGIKSSTALGPYRRIRNGAQETQEQLNPSKTQSPAALVQEMITFFFRSGGTTPGITGQSALFGEQAAAGQTAPYRNHTNAGRHFSRPACLGTRTAITTERRAKRSAFEVSVACAL